MITDKLTTFADALALNTGGAGDYVLGSTIDIGDLRDIGNGTMLYLVISVAETVTGGGGLSFSLVSDAVDPVLPASATKHVTTPEFSAADLNAGENIITVALPLEGPTYERYVGIVQHTSGGAFTGGVINAFLTPTPQRNRHYDEYAGL